MTPSFSSALPGAPSARASNASGSAMAAAEPAATESRDGAVDAVDGGFAAALEDAGITSEDATAGADASAVPATAPIAVEAPAEAAQDASAAPSAAVAAIATATATAAPSGWPPPGLSSLFPDRALFGAAASPSTPNVATDAAAAPASTPATASTTALAAPITAGGAALAVAAQTPGGTRGRFALLQGAEALPAEARGPRPPDAAAPPLAAGAAPAATAAIALSASANAAPAPAPADAIALALARQPTALRLPVADSESTDLAALASLAESIAPERLPDGALPLSTATTALPKLDLSQAFPAPVPLPSKQFADDVGARLQWMAEQNGGEATLRIAPDALGPVEVRMRLDGDRVELGFSASQNDTRQALQDALPKLREMLAQQGLQLGHADVGHKHAPSADDGAQNRARSGGDDDGDALAIAPPVRPSSLVIGRSGRGVLDLYA